MENIIFRSFCMVYEEGMDPKKVLNDLAQISKKELMYMGISYVTDGEGFESVTKFTMAEFANMNIEEKDQQEIDKYKNMFLSGSDTLTNYLNKLKDEGSEPKFSGDFMEKINTNGIDAALTDMFNKATEIPKSVEFSLSRYNHDLIIDIAKFLLSEIIIITDILNSLDKFLASIGSTELTLDDVKYLCDHKTKAHSRDKFLCKVRKGETWTVGKGIVDVIKYDFNIAFLRASIRNITGKL